MAMKCSATGADDKGAWKCERICNLPQSGLCRTHYSQQRLGKELTRIRARKQPRRHDPQDMIGNGVPPGHQECTQCSEIKPLSEFKAVSGSEARKSYCKSCESDKHRDRVYGPGASKWFRAKLAEQNGECDGCGTDNPGVHSWQLHHNHDICEDGKDPASWESVLCWHCNVSEGYVRRGWNAAEFVKRMGLI